MAEKKQLVGRLLEYARGNGGYTDIIEYCEAGDVVPSSKTSISIAAEIEIGFVYLIKSGRFYKIGRSNAVGRREREITLQLPEKAATIHIIRTDDPVGIEVYWHNRFREKRKNGEWFDLSAQEVGIFKKRKFM